jgi:methyl-accepting chemotaxis protein
LAWNLLDDSKIFLMEGEVGIMLKNMRIGLKLILVGTLIMAVPLAAVAFFSITKARAGLVTVTNEEVQHVSRQIAQQLDQSVQSEIKLLLTLANDRDFVAAAVAVNERSAAKLSDKEEQRVGAAVELANSKLASFQSIKEIGADYEGIPIVGLDGICFANNDPKALGMNLSERAYVKNGLAGQVSVNMATVSKVTGQPVLPIGAPLYSNGKVVGAIAFVIKLGFLSDLIKDVKIGKTGYVFLTDNTGLVIAHPAAENVFKLNMTTLKGMETVSRRMINQESGVQNYVFQGGHKTAGFAPVKSTQWSVGLTMPDSEFLAAANETTQLVLIIAAASLLVAFLVYLLFSRSITKPLSRGVAFTQALASGDFTQHLNIHQKDEVGILAESLNAMSVKLRDLVATIQDSSEQVASSSEEISASAQSLAEGSQSQASSLEETSASVEELTASVDQVAEHAQTQAAAVEQGSASMTQTQKSIDAISSSLADISALAKGSVERSTEGFQAVATVVEAISLISESSEKISGIVTVISEIADQTNLLALNASIEAARAGEHGRGFAVVADEVSKLADRSSTSTKEIESIIKESAKNISRGVEIAKGSQGSMEQIKLASQKVEETILGLSHLMTEQVASVKELAIALDNVNEMSQSISAATEEQTTNAKQVSKAIEGINDVTQSAASAAEEMSSSTEQLSAMAQQLQRLTAQFKIRADEDGSTKTVPGSAALPPRAAESHEAVSGAA